MLPFLKPLLHDLVSFYSSTTPKLVDIWLSYLEANALMLSDTVCSGEVVNIYHCWYFRLFFSDGFGRAANKGYISDWVWSARFPFLCSLSLSLLPFACLRWDVKLLNFFQQNMCIVISWNYKNT